MKIKTPSLIEEKLIEKQNEVIHKNKVFEELVVFAFAASELRDLWRKKFYVQKN